MSTNYPQYPEQPENEIWFYDNNKNYYEFSNFFACPITVALPTELDNAGKAVGYLTGPLRWKNSEQLFHAIKFTQRGNLRLDLINEINLIDDPRSVLNFAKSHNHDYDAQNWWYNGWGNPGYNIRAMKWVVREKFNQNPNLKNLLWETGEKEIFEHTTNDRFWGDNGNKSGQNWLGKILIEIRKEIIKEKGKVYNGPAEEPEIPEPLDKKEIKALKRWIEDSIREIRNKLSAAGISSEQEIEILGNAWETNYRMSWVVGSVEETEGFKKEKLEAIDKYIAKNSTEPTSEQINNVKNQLNNVKNINNKEEIINTLNDTQEVIKNSSDESLKKQREQLEDRLGQIDKSELRKIIKTEIENELKSLGINPGDLTSDIKQKYDELNNDIEPTQTKAIRTQVLNRAAIQSLDKIIVELMQALKEKEIKRIEGSARKLQAFINSKSDYQKNAYEAKKDKVQQLLEQTKNQQSSPKNNQGQDFFRINNPLMWLSGVGIVGLFAGIILVVRGCRKKEQNGISKNSRKG